MIRFPSGLSTWTDAMQYEEVQGMQIAYQHHLSIGSAPILFLHGFPTSSFDFAQVLKRFPSKFASRGYVLHDHPGFGLSDKPAAFSYSLKDQAAVALALWEKLGITEGHLVAHDYGTSVATEILALRAEGDCPVEIKSVTMSNGSMLIDLAGLRPIQKLLRSDLLGPVVAQLTSFGIFRRNMKKIWGDASQLSDTELQLHWWLMLHKNGRKVLSPISKYTYERTTFKSRWIGALNKCGLPVHFLWALRDPVAKTVIGETLHKNTPESEFTALPDLGHYPMLENPKDWGLPLFEFIDKQ